MSRRHAAVKRQILPDAKYNDVVVAKFINCVMKQGKKSIAEAIVYDAFELLEKTSKMTGIEAFRKALDNVKPSIEVRSKRIGGATYQVPCDVREVRKVALGMKWLITYSMKRSEKTMKERLAKELDDALNNRGQAVKKREEVFKMAEANKAFSHFR